MPVLHTFFAPCRCRWLMLSVLMCLPLAHAEPDEEALGKSLGYPISSGGGVMQMTQRVGSWSALDKVQGIHGQTVFVQPASGIVMVQTAVYAGASGALDPDPHAERASFWLGVLQSLGGNTDRY